jgi:hypothetical protein
MSGPTAVDNSDFVNAFATANYDTPLTVKDAEYQLAIGTTTQFGYYKSDYQVRTIQGKQGKHDYLKATVFTSRGGAVDVEEVWLFRKTDKALMKWLGFDGVDLLGIDAAEGTRQEMDMRLQHLAARVPSQQ